LLLLTLTENIFKHGLVNDPLHPALIMIGVENSAELHFQATNTKKYAGYTSATGRLGLRNLRLRLELGYPGRYQLEIDDTTETYHVDLHIIL
jgi:two-component system, LytTR family, sensor kinase